MSIPFNDEVKWILGQPCFILGGIADQLRKKKIYPDMPTKAEAEQAAVLHWELSLYLEHGEKWRNVANEILFKDTDPKEPS